MAPTQFVGAELPAGNSADVPGSHATEMSQVTLLRHTFQEHSVAFFGNRKATIRDPRAALWPGPPRAFGPTLKRC
jgi:hypothetical protein